MIVRELVTRLGFTFDRTNLDKFERSIVGFKTKVTIAAAGVAAAFKKGFDFVSNIADAAVATKDLADYAGIAAEEFVALQNAARKLSLDPQKFAQGVQKLAIGIKEASRGAGEFFEIVKQTQGRINFRGLQGELLSVREVLLQIFDYINAIPDQSEKLRILGNLFDPESAGAWLRVVSQGRQEFIQLVDKEKEFGKAFQSSIPEMIKFQQEVSNLGKEWDKLTQTIAQALVPVLHQSLAGFNAIIDRGKELGGGFSGFLKGAGEAVKLGVEDLVGVFTGEENSYIRGLKERQAAEDMDFWRRVNEQQAANAQNRNSANVTNNNTFEFNVPPGTTEQQASFMSDQLKQTLNSYWDEKTREVISNNPQVE